MRSIFNVYYLEYTASEFSCINSWLSSYRSLLYTYYLRSKLLISLILFCSKIRFLSNPAFHQSPRKIKPFETFSFLRIGLNWCGRWLLFEVFLIVFDCHWSNGFMFKLDLDHYELWQLRHIRNYCSCIQVPDKEKG